ncbi:MAG: transglycosylase domain-containing protein [Acidimicrobiia bacterium]
MEGLMRRLPQALRAFFITVVIGGVSVGACLAALIPGADLLGGASFYESTKIGELSDLAQRSTIYDADNRVLAVLGLENREPVDLDAVPEVLQNAVVAGEDKTFWRNNGVDLNGTLRAFIKNLTEGGIVQGGSTISQQLVKNRILSNKRDINRKIREIILALQLNEKFSKREILEQYLNTVYFGQGSYGVKSAVERFFLNASPFGPVSSTDLANVSIGQAALLAGLISNPEGNNPFLYPERAKLRRELALENMVEEEYITQAQADAANLEPLPNPALKPPPELRPRTSWGEEVQDRLFTDPIFEVLGSTPKERRQKVLTGGLKIYATLDPKLQADAQNAVDSILPTGADGFTASLVSIDPRNGYVKAMVAGPGFENSEYNIATSYPGRQSGSTWKVITLAAGLESGFSPADIVNGASPCEFKQYGRTINAEGGGGGPMTMRAATASSVNCAFARMELAAGFQRVMDTAQKMGITQNTLKPILTLTLGTIETTALEMATVTATIASGGIHRTPTFVSKIVAPDGEVVFDAKNLVSSRAISANAAACETDLMRGVVSGGTGTAARLNDRPTAGKTGTTDNLADANFLGFTPQLATFIWHGSPLARIPGAGFGGGIPARIFKRYMDAALTGEPVLQFPPPGPFCARSAAFITENGRVATFNGLFPGQSTIPTQIPPTVIINTLPTLPPTTSTTAPKCVPPDSDPSDPDCDP